MCYITLVLQYGIDIVVYYLSNSNITYLREKSVEILTVTTLVIMMMGLEIVQIVPIKII